MVRKQLTTVDPRGLWVQKQSSDSEVKKSCPIAAQLLMRWMMAKNQAWCGSTSKSSKEANEPTFSF